MTIENDAPRAILFASGKGGSGKSTLCAGIAAALAGMGKKVIALDADCGMRNLDIYMGLCEYTLFDLSDYIEGRTALPGVLTAHPDIPGLSLIAAPSGMTELPAEKMREIAGELEKQCDFLLVDAPAGIGSGFYAAAAACREAIVVATPDLAAVSDAGTAAAHLRSIGIREVHLAANRVKSRVISRGLGVNLDRMIDRIAVPLIGYVHEDGAMPCFSQNVCAMMREKRCPVSSRDMKNIARRLCGERVRMALK